VFVCSGDTIAAYALISCEKLGIKVPYELSITGFDGIPIELAPWASLLTTMRQPLAEMGSFAAKRLLWHIQNPGEAPQKTLFHTALIPGETVNTERIS
jgi:LacI family transcriptional regulator